MSQIDTILTLIAQKHLGIETLQTRHADSLDFHDTAVWCLRDALEAAFKAGAELGAAMANGVRVVFGSKEAVEAAKVNAALNGLTNCHFIAGDVLKVLDNLTEKPDMIILDLGLPDGDGIEIIKNVREKERILKIFSRSRFQT